MKKILILIVILLMVSGVVYFVINKKPQEEGSKDIVSERNQARIFQSDNFPTGTTEELVIGEKVIIIGTENQDGSIIATMILIGTLESTPEFSSDMHRDSSNRSMPEGFDEERMESMQEIRANADGNFRAMGGRMADNAAFIRGEIINKDEISITIKLTDSGSKLIFYSDNTEIRIQE